jgi:CDP-diacylglycerol--serine O-phosphatidyltransferase
MLLNKKLLPFIATLFNLTFGILSMAMTSLGYLNLSAIFILIGGCFDIFDGLVARKINSTSQIGKQTDSLADLVTFGISPAFLYFQSSYSPYLSFKLFVIIFYISCAALRLARFNVLTSGIKDGYFVGLPTTVAGCGIASSFLFSMGFHLPYMEWAYLIIFILLSLLMISDFRYPKLILILKK